ncbi:MAG: response regulator [Deltaproteobacteria bacterium]|nr:response regulator [Deltaproteobacteria bacterium]
MDNRPPKLLCVDDDLEQIELLQEYFTQQGFDVLTATNGVEVLFHVKRWNPQAVILDLFMPRLGGLGALQRIRMLDPGIVVILISGMPDALEIVAKAGLSVDGVFAKPLDLTGISRSLALAGVPLPGPSSAAARGGLRAGAEPSTRKRVLVVDDDPDFRELLVEFLQRKGFDARGAGDGEEALRRIPEFSPDMVLLDIAMPGLGGVETLGRITALSQETAVIMVSSNEDVETVRWTLALGAADYVSKPINFRYLESILDLHLLMARLPSSGFLGSL